MEVGVGIEPTKSRFADDRISLSANLLMNLGSGTTPLIGMVSDVIFTPPKIWSEWRDSNPLQMLGRQRPLPGEHPHGTTLEQA